MSAVADVLNAAADLIERDGWCQGHYYRGDTGERCLDGAIAVAGQCGSWYDRSVARDVVQEVIGASYQLIDWNDRPGRTQAEVVAALRAAAERAS